MPIDLEPLQLLVGHKLTDSHCSFSFLLALYKYLTKESPLDFMNTFCVPHRKSVGSHSNIAGAISVRINSRDNCNYYQYNYVITHVSDKCIMTPLFLKPRNDAIVFKAVIVSKWRLQRFRHNITMFQMISNILIVYGVRRLWPTITE